MASKNCDKFITPTVRVSVVVPVSELQMLVKAQSFLKSVAIRVQELLILILSRFTDCLGFWICFATQMGFKVLIFSFVPHRALPLTARRYNYVSVTRRKHRVGSWYFSQKAVTVQGGYGVVFAVRVQIQ